MRDLRESFKLLQNEYPQGVSKILSSYLKKHRGSPKFFQITSKKPTGGSQNSFKLPQKKNTRSSRDSFKLLQKQNVRDLGDSFKLLQKQNIHEAPLRFF